MSRLSWPLAFLGQAVSLCHSPGNRANETKCHGLCELYSINLHLKIVRARNSNSRWGLPLLKL